MRTVTEIIVGADHTQAGALISGLMEQSGFKRKQYKGMDVWKKGNGWITAPQIFRMYPEGEKLIIESWLPFAILPGWFVGESGLDSFFGFAVKASMRSLLRSIIGIAGIPGAPVTGYQP